MFIAGLNKLFDDVLAIGSGFHYIEIIGLGVEECKAIVVLGSDDHVFHTRLLG